MRIIDDEGFVFGLVNIIDLLVILLVLSVAVAGVAFVTASTETDETHTQTVTFRTTPQPDYVIEAIPVGRVPTEDIAIVTRKAVTASDGGTVATLTVKLRVTFQGNAPMFREERLYVGRSLRLDFGTTIVDGTVIDMHPIEEGA